MQRNIFLKPVQKMKQKNSNKINNLLHSALEQQQVGNLRKAEHIFYRILNLQPYNADAYYGLGNVQMDGGNLDKALTSYEKAIELNPDHPGAYYNLGSIVLEKGKLDEAIQYYQKSLQLNPKCADTYNTIGAIFKTKNDFEEAIKYFRQAIQLDPNFAQPYNNLGLIFQAKRLLDESIEYFRKSLQIDPSYAKAHYNLGNVLQEKGQLDEAIARYQKVIELTPKFIDAYERLGITLVKEGKVDEAIEYYNRALSIKPDFAGIYVSLGRALAGQGKSEEAEACFRKALKISPNFPACYSNLLFLMLYSSRYDAQSILSVHLEFAKHCVNPFFTSVISHDNDKSLDRRLKIGYVSPDFREHSVSYFFEPVLLVHNRKNFKIYCYSDVATPDKLTDRIKAETDEWRNLVGMSDDQADELIREDRIDILVDLAGHTSPRILLFARKLAPVQVSWIGYPATTGLSTIDYKIVDNLTDPPGMTEQFYTEKLIRMPESFLCYMSDKEIPEINPLPTLLTGHITFGSFNSFVKIAPPVFSLWSRILKTIPHSRLIMKAWSFSDKAARQYALNMFAGEGISADRIALLPPEKSAMSHLMQYNRIDIGLDTFPYNGTTTTCEALLMGVPVITLAGNTHVSRVGMSLLSNVGLSDLIAKTPDEYVAIAENLAGDLKKLQYLREHLRGMMSQSPLTDAERFTSNLENYYRTMWENWCKSVNNNTMLDLDSLNDV